MADLTSTQERKRAPASPAAANLGVLHLLCFVGALVYFWGRAETAWEHFLALLQALVWPAYVVYGALQALFG